MIELPTILLLTIKLVVLPQSSHHVLPNCIAVHLQTKLELLHIFRTSMFPKNNYGNKLLVMLS